MLAFCWDIRKERTAMKDQHGSLGRHATDLLEAQLSGQLLYGDDLTPDQLQVWYEQEETGYFDLLHDYYRITDADNQYAYEYKAFNHLHAISSLLSTRFSCCVALGCAAGHDVTPLAPIVDHFIAIEPAEKWWRAEIGGKAAKYLKPNVTGDFDIPANTADLATSFGVLHHIPNVSHVVGEIARVLRPGGLFVVREPISWMGDWRRPRPGLTMNERGLPLKWFEQTVQENGFKIIRRHLCMFSPVSTIAKKLGVPTPYASMTIAVIDWVCSEMLRWNIHYRRDRVVKKIAPGCAFWVLKRQSPAE
jgi:SAM-dependent methyltransferase